MSKTQTTDEQQHNDDNNQFAFGADKHNGCACPALAAGFSPSSGRDRSLEPAEMFDSLVRERGDEIPHSGTVPEAVAREAWLKVIEKLEGLPNTDYRAEQIEVSKEIARELGWR